MIWQSVTCIIHHHNFTSSVRDNTGATKKHGINIQSKHTKQKLCFLVMGLHLEEKDGAYL